VGYAQHVGAKVLDSNTDPIPNYTSSYGGDKTSFDILYGNKSFSDYNKPVTVDGVSYISPDEYYKRIAGGDADTDAWHNELADYQAQKDIEKFQKYAEKYPALAAAYGIVTAPLAGIDTLFCQAR